MCILYWVNKRMRTERHGRLSSLFSNLVPQKGFHLTATKAKTLDVSIF